MPSFHSPQAKSVYRTDVLSPSKNQEFSIIREPHPTLRQKAISFEYETNYSNQIGLNNLISVQGKSKEKSNSNYHSISERLNQQEKQQNKHMVSKQNLFISDNQYFHQTKKQNHPHFIQTVDQNHFSPQNKFDKNYFKQRILHFQSLRSSMKINPNHLKNSPTDPFCTQLNHSINKTHIHNFSDNKRLLNKQSNLFHPSHMVKISANSANSSFQTKNKLKQQRKHNIYDFLSTKKISHLHELKQNVPSFFPLKNQDEKIIKERKVPSFLISRGDKKYNKKEQNNQFHPIQKMKIINHKDIEQSQEEKVKIPQIKKLLNTKHVKSHSVFQNLCGANRNSSFQGNQSLNRAHQAHDYLHERQIQVELKEKSNSIQENRQIKIGNNTNSQSNNLHEADQNLIIPKQLLAFRQSLDRFHFKANPIEQKIQTKKSEFVKQIPNHKKKVSFDKKYQKKSEDLIFERVQRKIPEKRQNKRSQSLQKKKNLQTIDDIKQTLISCDLFSEEDYKEYFQNNKKDILKHSKHPASQNNQFQGQSSRFKPSIKNLVDSRTSQELQSDESSDQQKKLAQIASICEKKRSKWILEQTDTIKQSLKQLSEFNTEKSLYENQWKKISIKDFNTSRKRDSVQIDNIYEINQEQSLFESKDFNLSSVKILSQTSGAEEGYRESDVIAFKKRKSYEEQVNLMEKFGEFSNVCLEDFTIKWAAEEPIFNENSSCDASFVLYTAQHRLTNFLFMIKKYDKITLGNLGASFMSNFVQSIRIQMKLLNHPNIEKIYTVFSDKNSIYILCEFTTVKLSQILSQSEQKLKIKSSQQSISLNTLSRQYQRAQMFREIIDGLEQVHLNNIVHKNFQPNSIRMIWDSCKISCFESCQIDRKPFNPKISQSYVCPQHLFDNTKTAMDIWCLGIIAFEILIGKKPFQSDSKSNSTVKKILQCNFDIPTQKVFLCEQVLNMALKRNPKDRASIFEIKNIWTPQIKMFSAILAEHKLIQKKLTTIIQN